MNDKFTYFPQPILPNAAPSKARPSSPKAGESFDNVLEAQLRPAPSLQFSRHALSRMESRNITFSGEEMSRLDAAVKAVSAKGGRDSLVMLGDNALVVSVRNATVVTVVDRESLSGNVFTNIDSAVIA